MEPSEMSILLKANVYARHGRELMRLKSSVYEPRSIIYDGSESISRRQGRYREVLSEGSRSTKL